MTCYTHVGYEQCAATFFNDIIIDVVPFMTFSSTRTVQGASKLNRGISVTGGRVVSHGRVDSGDLNVTGTQQPPTNKISSSGLANE